MASNTTTNPAQAPKQKGDAGHSIVLEERFNPDAMLACLAHPGIDAASKIRLKLMYKRRRDGNGLCATYSKNNKMGYGRLYADKGLSLQMVPADIRNALCCQLVHDIDMANAHPNIVLHLAKKHGWQYAIAFQKAWHHRQGVQQRQVEVTRHVEHMYHSQLE
jgi:hypothetical protein